MSETLLVDEEIRAIIASLCPEDRDYIRDLREKNLVLLHRTFGMRLRNAFRSGHYGALFHYYDVQEASQTRSFDSISARAIKLIWGRLQESTS